MLVARFDYGTLHTNWASDPLHQVARHNDKARSLMVRRAQAQRAHVDQVVPEGDQLVCQLLYRGGHLASAGREKKQKG